MQTPNPLAIRTRFVILGLATALGGTAWAAATNISSAPLFTAASVKPNILFLMDDSGSMPRNFLPDVSGVFGADRYGRVSTQCNGLAYNRSFVYSPPVHANGTPLDPAPLTSFGSQSYYVYTGAQPRLNFLFDAAGGLVWDGNPFMGECNSPIGNSPGNAVFTEVKVTPSSPDAQNYANWKLYYSTRQEMMKTAVKQVFATLDDGFRVGFSTTSSQEASDDTENPYYVRWDFLNVRDFTPAHKAKFFRAIDEATFYSDTPLRGALAKAGQYFANKGVQQNADPVERSCQRNFAILATDGGWTASGEKRSSGATENFGPFQLDNVTEVGPGQDRGETRRPMFDAGGSTVSSLADVAAYYYNTDLRQAALGNCTGALGGDVCKNDVVLAKDGWAGKDDPYRSFGDAAAWQHMTTITLGLGVNGNLRHDPAYQTARSGDFHDIVTGGKNWPQNFDVTVSDNVPPAHVDDLWHAAVNGRGQYFSANDPASLVAGLSSALSMVKASKGSASAASSSSMQPVAGDNDVYVANFTSQLWTGDVLAYTISPSTGEVSDTPKWSAQERLDAADPASRRIYYAKDGALREFRFANLSEDALGGHFEDFCGKTGASGLGQPQQCGLLAGSALTSANAGANLVNYLRGEHGFTYYRKRQSRLGDIVNASPLYIGKPAFPYADPSYLDYKRDYAGRRRVILAGANDGMLHAFDRADGSELWAFVPTAVMSGLYRLADTSYANHHRFFVDGSPQMGDIQVGPGWKTIVVGGLNAGGRGYYALDVTDPANPQFLWEFQHDDLGLSFGNPIITKRGDGRWVVLLTSGYNNVSPGDGNGHLFVLDAATGAQLHKLPTLKDAGAAGSTTTPSGLAKINVWVDDETDNTARRIYGGDLLGNLWRFDMNDTIAPSGREARHLALLKGPTGEPQSITTKPVLAEVKYNGTRHPVVYVGTGRYLGMPDLADLSVQSVYAIRDPLDESSLGDVRARSDFVVQTISAGTDSDGQATRTSSSEPVDWGTHAGWRADFPAGGERVSVNPGIALDTLYVAANLPSPNTCQAGGSSFLYEFNIATGASTADYQGDVLVQGITLIQLTEGDNAGAVTVLTTNSDGTIKPKRGRPPTGSSSLKRASWRELVD